MSDHCPLCGAAAALPLWSRTQVPVSQATLYGDVQSAQSVERGELSIVACTACEFAWNKSFNAAHVTYDEDYEGTQAASGVFSSFMLRQVDRVIAKSALGAHGKVLELGAGQGEFLCALHQVSGARCLGFDPAYRSHSLPEGVRLEATLMPEDHAGGFDLFACRMTLEHLQNPGRVLDWIAALKGGAGARLFFTVPSAECIWREGVFWDLYYEHVNYFTAPSLRSALIDRGFTDVEITAQFGQQYLEAFAGFPIKVGEVSQASPGSQLRLEAVRQGLKDAVTDWRRAFHLWAERGLNVALWSGASKTVAFLDAVPESRSATIVDINPRRHGKYLPGSGVQICDPKVLAHSKPDVIVAMNPNYLEEIAVDLGKMGVAGELRAVTPPPSQL